MDFRVVNMFMIAACRFVFVGSGGDVAVTVAGVVVVADGCLERGGNESLEGIEGDEGIVFVFVFVFVFVRDA